MPNKLLVEFLADFATKEDVRCRVLKHEVEGPTDYGLDVDQVNTLNTFDLDTIFEAAKQEMIDLGIDLAAKAEEIHGGGGNVLPTHALTAGGVEASMYSGGQIHIRKLEPPSVKTQTKVTITVLGNGFDEHPQVRLSKGADEVLGTVKSTSCDVDLYQRVEIEVTIPSAGEWKVQARNASNEAWNSKDVGKLTVKP